MPSDAELRLRRVPWRALAGLATTLDPALTAVLEGQPAERVLDRLLRSNRDFSTDQRAVCAEALFGVGLWRRRLRAQVDGTPLQLLAVLARELGGEVEAPALLGVELPPLTPLPGDWRVAESFPDWIAEHLTARFGDEAHACARVLNVPGPVCLRARGSRETLRARLLERGVESQPTRFAANGLVVTSPRPNLLGLGLQGEFEVQDEGSQLLGELVDAQPGDEVLDLCAGAGGKSLQLAAAVGEQGRVHATDIDLARLDRLRTRASKANARVLIHGKEPPAELRVARVLVDAPCSELGVLRRGPDVRWRIEPSIVEQLVPVQRELVERGLRHLAPGGRLVYATCTITRAENEGVVEAVLAAHPEVVLVRPRMPDAVIDSRGFLVTSPHRHGTDGFFGAVLERRR